MSLFIGGSTLGAGTRPPAAEEPLIRLMLKAVQRQPCVGAPEECFWPVATIPAHLTKHLALVPLLGFPQSFIRIRNDLERTDS